MRVYPLTLPNGSASLRNMTIEEGELATSVTEKSKNENYLFGQCWKGQTTSLIAFIFGVLVNVGKKG